MGFACHDGGTRAVNDRFLRLYHRLPGAARSLVATFRGLYLRSWRYGPETERLVAEAHERERWSADRWRRWQEERLAYVLDRAATKVPFYREYWAARRRNGDRASWGILENWPVLEKESVRVKPRAFLADDRSGRALFHEHTSGTSGTPLDLWWSHATVRAWYALFEARWRRWYGVSRRDRWAILGGQLVTPAGQRKPPFWVWNAGLSQLYMSAYHLAPDLLPHYCDALRRYRVKYLFGYPSALHALAVGARDRDLGDLGLAVAITNAEPVLDYQREAIEAWLHCSVRETYGMAEIVAAAGECEQAQLHLWPEVGWIEVVKGSDPVPAGEVGEFICTGLLNVDMPLVRYRLGDRGARRADAERCRCGRTLPMLSRVEGRIDDVLYTPDGRLVGRLDPVFKGQLAIREAQVIQEALDLIRVRYVPAEGFSEADTHAMVDGVRARMGAVRVVVEQVDAIPRTKNGKLRSVVCNVHPDELRRLVRAG